MAKGKAWTEDRFKEVEAWRLENNESDNAAENHFHISHGYMKKLRRKYLSKPGKVGRSKRKRASQALPYMDIVHDSSRTSSAMVTIIRCPVDQIQHVLGGLK